ncbi:amidohydrolase [Saccharopolyspora karakumensis]|uniref:Amidohydrolase n=1 Tax=Saccharopolyspora karakumensis TaxID=2530386 RepID=A0A4R5B438_9PSEU|nr:amidohydrolase [Saccharopolyspora karakumensis]TDD80551.1 amidohydrolase [Saccharopolyspora karakumensis]
MEFDEIVALRRDFHRHAEPAFLEIRTSSAVTAHLRELGLQPQTGQAAMRTDTVVDYPSTQQREQFAERATRTGANTTDIEHAVEFGTAVIAEVRGRRPGPTWGLRFDMDALPLTESDSPEHAPAARGFRCEHDVMHACGHDGHTAIGLGLASRLVADDDFAGTVRFLFQPAEEGGRGAASMIAAGAAEGIDRFVAVHLGLDEPVGQVSGGIQGLLATTKMRATFTGTAAHAAGAPEQGANALVTAASALLNVMALPRYSTAHTRINVGTLHGGDNVNIVPSWAEMTLEARSTDSDVSTELTERIKTALRGAGAMHGVAVDVVNTGGSATMDCDVELVEAIDRIAAELTEATTAAGFKQMGGSDDASLFAREVQRHGGTATYMTVGGGNTAPHHNPLFDIDERALPIALEVLERLVRR